MEVSATTKYIRMSASKARDVAASIKGLPVLEAYRITDFTPRKAALQIGKTLRSAVANAEHNEGVSADKLFVKNAYVDGGPVLKRFRPRARGTAGAILKRTSHITVVVSDESKAGEE